MNSQSIGISLVPEDNKHLSTVLQCIARGRLKRPGVHGRNSIFIAELINNIQTYQTVTKAMGSLVNN